MKSARPRALEVYFGPLGVVRALIAEIDEGHGEELYRVSLRGRRLGLLLHEFATGQWYWKAGFQHQWKSAGRDRTKAVKALIAHAQTRTSSTRSR